MKITCLLLLINLSISSISQTHKFDSTLLYTRVYEQAEKMSSLFLKNNLNEYIKYLNPEMLKAIGGKRAMIEMLKKNIIELKSYGDSIIDVITNKPSKILKKGGELQCTFSQIIIMKVPNGKLVTKTKVIGISTDKGKRWFFMDCAGKDIETLIIAYPNLSKELIIEKDLDPAFIKDK